MTFVNGAQIVHWGLSRVEFDLGGSLTHFEGGTRCHNLMIIKHLINMSITCT